MEMRPLSRIYTKKLIFFIIDIHIIFKVYRMKLSISNESVEYILDTLGNLYLKHGEHVYDFVIGMDNTISIEELPSNYEIDLTEIEINCDGKLVMLSNPKSLKDQIEISDSIEKNDDGDKYYYENNLYDEGDIYDDDEIEEYVTFMYTNPEKKSIKIIELGESVALYDVIVHNIDLKSNDIVMKTKLVNQIPIYRINICSNNMLSFRPIGCEQLIYSINIDNNNKLKLINEKK